jgi:hypothetical protein
MGPRERRRGRTGLSRLKPGQGIIAGFDHECRVAGSQLSRPSSTRTLSNELRTPAGGILPLKRCRAPQPPTVRSILDIIRAVHADDDFVSSQSPPIMLSPPTDQRPACTAAASTFHFRGPVTFRDW